MAIHRRGKASIAVFSTKSITICIVDVESVLRLPDLAFFDEGSPAGFVGTALHDYLAIVTFIDKVPCCIIGKLVRVHGHNELA